MNRLNHTSPCTRTRRETLTTLAHIALGSAMASLAACSPRENAKPVAQEDYSIPPQLGIAQVTVSPAKPSKVVFVFSEMHDQSFLSAQDRQKIAGIQDSIYSSILELQRRFPIVQLFKDGMDQSALDAMQKSIKYLREAEREPLYAKVISDPNVRAQLLAKLTQGDPKQQELAKTIQYIVGIKESLATDAALRMLYSGKANLLVTEDSKLQKESLEIANKDGALENPRFHELAELRENFAIQQFAMAAGKHQVMISGVLHKFKDNVENWNKAHPDQQILLVEIMPKGLTEFYAEYMKRQQSK